MFDKEIIYFWISTLGGIGSKKIKDILAYYGDIRECAHCKEKQLRQITSLNSKDREKLVKRPDLSKLGCKLNGLQQKGILFVSRENSNFPRGLLEVEPQLFWLYYRGALPDSNKPSVAIVGARSVSYEGEQIASRFGRELAENGIQVISGMARGVDGSAQRGVVRIPGGKTYAVLGTGVDICYPRENEKLYYEIIKEGAVMSEYPPGTPGRPGNFPMRNRIVSGLADGILVIEARKNSGSLITAQCGLEQGKEIFVVPGSIVNSAYEGSNQLIQDGALLVKNTRDILDGLGIFLDYNLTEKKEKNKLELETPEKIVYAILGLEPTHVSRIAEKTGMTVSDAIVILMGLVEKKLVRVIGHQYFAAKL